MANPHAPYSERFLLKNTARCLTDFLVGHEASGYAFFIGLRFGVRQAFSVAFCLQTLISNTFSSYDHHLWFGLGARANGHAMLKESFKGVAKCLTEGIVFFFLSSTCLFLYLHHQQFIALIFTLFLLVVDIMFTVVLALFHHQIFYCT
jgi:hypothetical protein